MLIRQNLEAAFRHEAHWHTALHLLSIGGNLRRRPTCPRPELLQLGAFPGSSPSWEDPLQRCCERRCWSTLRHSTLA